MFTELCEQYTEPFDNKHINGQLSQSISKHTDFGNYFHELLDPVLWFRPIPTGKTANPNDAHRISAKYRCTEMRSLVHYALMLRCFLYFLS